jgi:hypothetical protein
MSCHVSLGTDEGIRLTNGVNGVLAQSWRSSQLYVLPVLPAVKYIL